jgi:hypothetical protein
MAFRNFDFEPATGCSRMKTCSIGDAIHPDSRFSGVPTIIFLDQGGSPWAEELFQCQIQQTAANRLFELDKARLRALSRI